MIISRSTLTDTRNIGRFKANITYGSSADTLNMKQKSLIWSNNSIGREDFYEHAHAWYRLYRRLNSNDYDNRNTLNKAIYRELVAPSLVLLFLDKTIGSSDTIISIDYSFEYRKNVVPVCIEWSHNKIEHSKSRFHFT